MKGLIKNKIFIYVLLSLIAIIVVGVVLIFTINGKKYKVTFDTNGGTNIESITLNKDSEFKLPKDPTKDGYIFVGWMDESGNIIKNDTKINDDLKLKAIWKQKDLNTFIVKFDSNGGSEVSSMTVTKGETLKLPNNPTREGYTFKVWEDSFGTPIYDGALLDVENEITLKAVWQEAKSNTYTVHFNSNGGSEVASIVVVKGQTLKLPANPTKSGYTFRVWEDSFGTPIYNDALLDVETEITLNAAWNKVN